MNSTGYRLLFSHCVMVPMISVALVLSTGCTLCQECGDLDYPTYGGAWERTRRASGRVGSVFDPAGARSAILTDRDSINDESSLRKPGESTRSTGPDGEASGSYQNEGPTGEGPMDDGPPNQQRQAPGQGDNSSPSPSDRDQNPETGPNSDSLRELELDDISVERGELLPPEIR